MQEVDGKLVDYTRPPYNDRAALDNAFKTGDFVVTDKYDDAQWYTENYKKYYPKFKDGGKVNKEDKTIRNKNEYIDRLNKLIPMEILMPLGGAGFAGYELNKE